MSQRMDLREAIETQIKRIDNVLSIKVGEVVNQHVSAKTSSASASAAKNAPAPNQVEDICRLADTIARLVAQANTM